MKLLILSALLVLKLSLSAQTEEENNEQKKSVTAGILQGGGALIGADVEFLITDRFGVQVGAGIIGFGGGVNFHLKPSIRSSFISLQYWNQGIGDSFAQNVIGPNFVYRSKKWFTYQLGLGVPLQEGPAFPENVDQPPVLLMYSIGAYFPW